MTSDARLVVTAALLEHYTLLSPGNVTYVIASPHLSAV